MATVLIPEDWKRDVCEVLGTRDGSLIPMTNTACADWESTFPQFWLSDLYGLIIQYLKRDGVEGRFAPDMVPPGVAYEFICEFEGRGVLIKINLRRDGKVHIVSAHIPRKGRKL